MAIAVQVAGLAEVWVGTGTAGALECLGYTRNGVNTTHQAFFLDVPGDANGGDQGPPIDIQFLGEITQVRIELTKYDPDVFGRLCERFGGAETLSGSPVAGTPVACGSLVFANAGHMHLKIATGTNPIQFPAAFPRQPIEINRGTKFSTVVCEFECHKDPIAASDYYGHVWFEPEDESSTS
jgi:hypothetical protein